MPTRRVDGTGTGAGIDEGSDLAAHVERLVGAFRTQGGDAELEVRLGTFRAGRGFVAGVCETVFAQLERDMGDASTLRVEHDWRELVDFHYVLPNGAHARTRVEVDCQRIDMKKTHVVKACVGSVVYGRGSDDEAGRVACATETPLATPPEMCMPTIVRVQQRKTFVDVRDGQAAWRYELSRTWSGPTRIAADHAQANLPPTLEVECELAHGAYLDARTDRQVAESMLLKTALLLGDTDTSSLHVVDVQREDRKRRRR